MVRFFVKIGKVIRGWIFPPTWRTISEKERESLLSLDVEARKHLSEAISNDQVADPNFSESGGGHASGVDTGGSDGADAGGAMGNILADMRREMIREARRQGERNGRKED